MSEAISLSVDERALLHAALATPVSPDPRTLQLCLNLCGRGLMQRAGAQAAAQGWRGSPHAFVLTRPGWALLKAERRRPLRRAG